MEYSVPESAQRLLSRLWTAGYEAYFVGGCVRDLLRGKAPSDYDMTTSATPEEMKRVFAGERIIETGIKHGTLTVLSDGVPYEITTYRIDGTYTDSRHPDSVSFTRSLTEDLARRDFTVNAMAYAPDRGIFDPFGGQDDLRAGLLRAVGEPSRRFTEDALRILRALRFSSTLGFAIEERTAEAAKALAERLSSVAAERIRVELCKLIAGVDAERVLLGFRELLFKAVPSLAMPRNRWEEAVARVAALPAAPSALRLTALLSPLGAHGAAAALTALRFDRKTADRVLAVLDGFTDPMPEEEYPLLVLLSSLGEEGAFDRAALYATVDRDAANAAEATLRRLLSEGRAYRISDLAVDGSMLMACGIPRGREVGQTLSRLLDLVMRGEVINQRETLLNWINTKGDKNHGEIENG